MTGVRRMRGIAAVLVTLTAAALATTAQGPPQPATSGRTAPRTVSIRLHLVGCDSCSVRLQHAVDGAPKVWTSKQKRVGSDHVVNFEVRRSLTRGMSFVLDAPWEGDTGAVPNVVT